MEGREEGLEKGKVVFVKSLLDNTDFTDEKIAALASVTLAVVQEVKAQSTL